MSFSSPAVGWEGPHRLVFELGNMRGNYADKVAESLEMELNFHELRHGSKRWSSQPAFRSRSLRA